VLRERRIAEELRGNCAAILFALTKAANQTTSSEIHAAASVAEAALRTAASEN
jgi:hypothetical protein